MLKYLNGKKETKIAPPYLIHHEKKRFSFGEFKYSKRLSKRTLKENYLRIVDKTTMNPKQTFSVIGCPWL